MYKVIASKIILLQLTAVLGITLLMVSACDRGYFKYKLYYSQFDSIGISTIDSNWNQYFANDLRSEMEIKGDIFSLRLDSYGCVYPDDSILNGIDAALFKGTKSPSNLETNSFYGLFKSKDARDILDSNIKNINNPKRKRAYEELREIAQSNREESIDEFTTKWDSIFLADYESKLKKKLGNKKKVLFFVHGYNVPYSLANLQLKEFIELADSITSIDTSQYLFVPVYWPSNDLKKHDLDSVNFNVNDRMLVSNFKGWTRYSNRAYYAAFTLRHFLSSLDSSLDVKIFTHSLGATVATTALIDTRSKMSKKGRLDGVNGKEFDTLDPKIKTLLKKKDPIVYDFLKGMVLARPIQRITVFMNAPAIPGANTFSDIEADTAYRYMFYSGYNYHDKMVGKFRIPWAKPCLSSTSLGSNHRCEVNDTREIFIDKGLADKFDARITGTQKDHDIFSYFQQQGFRDMLILFFKEG